ncbi:hypothetical protein [Mesonia aquimarina]|uniref:hypothetical protein n=1 Tax=Mesonia aquimarina TaxID=1504967 RepID=UPI0013CEDBCA|nr:hypothetical protein [Mesonia aquimarina]
MKKFGCYFFVILFLVSSCQKVKKKSNEFIDHSKTELADFSKKTWKNSVEFTFRSLSSVENVNLGEIYAPLKDSLKIHQNNGVRFNSPLGFNSCFFKYKADKKEVLEYLSIVDTRLPNISDENYLKTDGDEIFKSLSFIEEIFPKYNDRISFFYEVKDNPNFEFYRCNKYPRANYLAINRKSGMIYHLVSYYWD